MRRDWNLIRALLLQLEGADVDLGEYPPGVVDYHRDILADNPLCYGARGFTSQATVLVDLTERGHDFLSWARHDENWQMVMSHIQDRGAPECLDIIESIAGQLLIFDD